MNTLVLSQAYEPVAFVPWQRAITLLWMGKVEIVEEYENETIRSVTLEFKVPSIIRFLRGSKHRKRAIKFSRENVYTRDKGRCQYCGLRLTGPQATYDHVNPRAQGGHTRWENVVIACVPCNQKKGGRTPVEAGMRLLSIPAKPTKLPDTFRLTFTWDKTMPPSWKNYLASVAYWAGELEQD